MKQFVAVAASTSGAVYRVTAPDSEEAYRVVGRDVYGMDYDALDTADVDVDLYELPEPSEFGTVPGVVKLEFPD